MPAPSVTATSGPVTPPGRAEARAEKKAVKAAAKEAAARAKRAAAAAKARAAKEDEIAWHEAQAAEMVKKQIDALPPTRDAVEQALRDAALTAADGGLRLTEFPLWGNQWPNTEVAGESHHRESLAALYRPHGRLPGTEFFARAHLVPELMADYPEAVRVDIEGHPVGYLEHGDGRKYRPVVAKLAVEGSAPTVHARVWATNDDGTWRGRVTVALDAPEMLVPVNRHPGQPAVDLPEGRSVKVTGREAHLDVLSPLVRAGLKSGVWVTLHASTVTTARTEKRVVEVRVDGRAVGALTPATSAGILPLVDKAEGAGRIAVARGYVSGNSLSVDLSVSLARTADLDEEWISENLAANT